MEKLSENYKMGCSLYDQMNQPPCGCVTFQAITPAYMRCDIGKLVNRLREYEELDMSPEEIKTVLGEYKDQLKKAIDMNGKILNENTNLMDENESLKKVIRELQADKAALMMQVNRDAKLATENARLALRLSQTEEALNEYKEIGLGARAIGSLLKSQDKELREYQKWLGRYHELGLTPDEIRQILKDGEEIADACIEYKNKLIDMQDAWEVARKKAYGYDAILDYGRFSVDDIEEWKRKAEKYDKMNILEADIEPAVSRLSACDVCVFKDVSYIKELKRKSKLYDELVSFFSDRIANSHRDE